MNNVMVETFENFAVLRSPSAFAWFTVDVTVWQIHFMEYSPTSLFWGIANSCVGFISDMSLKSRVGSFGNCELKVSALDSQKDIERLHTSKILEGVWPAGPAFRSKALRRTVPVNGTRIILPIESHQWGLKRQQQTWKVYSWSSASDSRY
jgi:hypothetical protein